MEIMSLHFNNQYGQTIMYQLIYPQVKPLKSIETTDCVKPIWGPRPVSEWVGENNLIAQETTQVLKLPYPCHALPMQ